MVDGRHLESIIDVCGPLRSSSSAEELWADIEIGLIKWGLGRVSREWSPADTAKVKHIESSTGRLLKVLGIAANGGSQHRLPHEVLLSLVQGYDTVSGFEEDLNLLVCMLIELQKRAKYSRQNARVSIQRNPGKKRRQGRNARKHFITNYLPRVFRKHFRIRLGVSGSTKGGGPFVRFVIVILRSAGDNRTTPSAIVKLCRRTWAGDKIKTDCG